MGHKDIWNSHSKAYGKGTRRCRVCGNRGGLIRKYGINICRQCFKERAKDIGFIKVGHSLLNFVRDPCVLVVPLKVDEFERL